MVKNLDCPQSVATEGERTVESNVPAVATNSSGETSGGFWTKFIFPR